MRTSPEGGSLREFVTWKVSGYEGMGGGMTN